MGKVVLEESFRGRKLQHGCWRASLGFSMGYHLLSLRLLIPTTGFQFRSKAAIECAAILICPRAIQSQGCRGTRRARRPDRASESPKGYRKSFVGCRKVLHPVVLFSILYSILFT